MADADDAWAKSISPEKRPGTGRFHPEELTCFRRLPTPSAHIGRKAEHYWQSMGCLRRAISDSGLHAVPLAKGEFWRAVNDEPIKQGNDDVLGLDVGSSAARPYTPLEERTAMVLDQIFPKKVVLDISEREGTHSNDDVERSSSSKRHCMSVPASCSKRATASNLRQTTRATSSSRQCRLLQLRSKLFEKFTTMKQAFDIFSQGSGDYKKGLSRKQFLHFLGKHFSALGREEHERIFDFLDADKSGAISLSELHIAVEAAAPVRNLEDLRRKLIALGFSSMRNAIAVMEDHGHQHCEKNSVFTTSTRMSSVEFAGALRRIGILHDDEHKALFTLLTTPIETTTVSLDEFVSGLASVSPSLLLEDVRERLLKRYGSLIQAYRVLDVDDSYPLDLDEFVHHVTGSFDFSVHEARKTFHLIDIDGNGWISCAEFIFALQLAEPGLFLEEVRHKVRQRYRSIIQALALDEPPVSDAASPVNSPLASCLARKTLAHHSPQHQHQHGAHAVQYALACYNDLQGKTLAEFCSALSAVQLTDADTQMLFELMDVDHQKKLTPMTFLHGLRLFAPSCAIEDLRLRILATHKCIRDAFAEVVHYQATHESHTCLRREEALLDQAQFRWHLERLDLASGINVECVYDLIETRRQGGLHVGSLVVALQCASPGLQVPLPSNQRDAKARQQVRGQLAPFHRSALEFRSEMRRKLCDVDGCDAKQVPRCNVVDVGRSSGSTLLEQMCHTKSTPSLSASHILPELASGRGCRQTSSSSPLKVLPQPNSPQTCTSPGTTFWQQLFSPSSPTSPTSDDGVRITVANIHQSTRRSHKKVTKLLRARPASVFKRNAGEGDPILDGINEYYKCVGDTMASDTTLLKSPPRDLSQPAQPTRS